MLVETEGRLAQPTTATTRHHRGPLRPEQLLSVRQRQSRQLAGYRFRIADTVLLIVTSLLFFGEVLDGPLLETPLAEIIPVSVGAWTAWWLLRAGALYRFGRSERWIRHLGLVCIVGAVSAGAAGLAHALVPATQTELVELLALAAIWTVSLLVAHTTWCALVARWRSLGWLTPNLVVVGATSHAADLITTAIERRDMNILGIFDDRLERSPFALHGVRVLGDTEAMLRHRIMPSVDLVVVAIDPAATARANQIMQRLAVLPNKVTLLFDDQTGSRRSAAIHQLADAPLAPLHPATGQARSAFAKRVQDLAISVPALILAAPILAMIALAIRMDSPGPIFFRQRRHGFNNEEIVVWKFRTMRHETADAKAERQVTANDDRVTRVGRFLRKSSLDELPQLFNVVTGEMSLVGPRPHAIGMKTGETESAQLVAEYAHRHRIKPGMTGWAAIQGSRGPLHEPDEVARRVALDVDYIERQNFWLDLRIMLLTVPSLLGDRSTVR